MTLKEMREILAKGCIKKIGCHGEWCGGLFDKNKGIVHCSECQASLKTFDECIKAFREMIEKFREDVETDNYGHISRIKKDLLSQLPEVKHDNNH